jgi:hypothetical protein
MGQVKERTNRETSVPAEPKKTKRKRPLLIVLLSLLVLLVAFRLLLPFIVLKYVNKKLGSLKEYYGYVEDIDIALLRGAYVIKDIKIVKTGNDLGEKDTIPFFRSNAIDLSVQWKALFKGKIVGEIYVENPVLNFVKGKHKNENAKADTSDFRRLIKDLMPLTVNHFEIENGQIHYIDPFSKPHVDIFLNELYITASNLSNVNDSNKLLPAYAHVNALAYEGSLQMDVNFDALQKKPTFDMNAEIKHVNLVLLNDFLRAYGNFDTKQGSFGLYTEFAARDGNFGGYVKPIIKDLDIVQWNKEEGDLGQILWETIVGSAAEALQNQSKDQLATKLEIKGRFDNPDPNLWRAISFVLRNAFVRALKPSIDNSINITRLDDTKDKTFLEKLFGSGNKKKKDKNSK